MDRTTYDKAIRTIEQTWRNKYPAGLPQDAAADFLPYPAQALRVAFRALRRNHTGLPPIARVLDAVKAAHAATTSHEIDAREAKTKAEKKQEAADAIRAWKNTPSSPVAAEAFAAMKTLLGPRAARATREEFARIAEELAAKIGDPTV